MVNGLKGLDIGKRKQLLPLINLKDILCNHYKRSGKLSTRGCVAIKRGSGWIGVYNHSDSYPTGLVKDLWDYLHQDGVDLRQFAEELLKYDDWRNFLEGGICPYCGKVGQGQPHSIRGDVAYPSLVGEFRRYESADEMRRHFRELPAWQGRDEEIEREVQGALRIKRNVERTGFPDPQARYHEHGKLIDKITSEDADPLFIEWVYVIDPERRTITILTHQSDGKTSGAVSGDVRLRDDGFWDYGHCAYRHIVVCEISVDGDEPEWSLIEQSGDALSSADRG